MQAQGQANGRKPLSGHAVGPEWTSSLPLGAGQHALLVERDCGVLSVVRLQHSFQHLLCVASLVWGVLR